MKNQKVIIYLLIFLLAISIFQLTFAGGKKEKVSPEKEIIPLDKEISTEDLSYSVPQYPIKQEREAILAARKIANEMPGEVTLNLLISPDNVQDFEPFYPEWERETGIKLKTNTVPWPDWFKELMNISITKSDKYDVFMVCPKWVPDLAEAKVLENMDLFINKYKPQITDPNSPHRILDGLASYMKYRDNYYLPLSDTDVATLFLRKDWLEDPDNKRNFERKYGYPLDIPETYDEYRDQLEFFHNPAENRYGMVQSWAWVEVLWDFNPRFLSQKISFFDDEMNPNISSPEAVKAVKEMKENLKYAFPGTLEFDFARCVETFADGKVYSTLTMTAAQAAFEDPGMSKVVGRVAYAPQPGRMIGGELVRPQPQDWGWGYTVSHYSKNKELAYLYCQWMSGAAMNARVAFTPGGWYDVSKESNYDAKMFPELRRKNGGVYMDAWMENQKWQVAHCFPGIVMRGGEEYSGVLYEAISAVLKGAKEPEAALNEVAKKWEEITERYGREGQIESWNSCKAMFSPPVRKWLGYK